MSDFRDCKINMFLGHNRTGKSVTALKFAVAWKQAKKYRYLIAFDPQDRFKDIRDARIIEPNWEKYLDPKYKDICFIIDDYHMVVDERIDNNLLTLFALRNERGLEFIFITHNPELIRKKISYYITDLYLYKTQGTDHDFKGKLSNPELIIRLRHIVNSYVSRNGKGDYPNFPYVHINENDEFKFINFDPNKF